MLKRLDPRLSPRIVRLQTYALEPCDCPPGGTLAAFAESTSIKSRARLRRAMPAGGAPRRPRPTACELPLHGNSPKVQRALGINDVHDGVPWHPISVALRPSGSSGCEVTCRQQRPIEQPAQSICLLILEVD
jgi:hypothetical protein